MSEQYGGAKETTEDRQKKVHSLTLSVWDLVDSTKPWVLVPDGSLLGYFDWVPLSLRSGPWSPLAPVYLAIMTCLWVMGGIWWYQQPPLEIPQSRDESTDAISLYYNLLGFLWMSYLSFLVYTGPAGGKAWATYSMWTWSIVNVRHGLSVLDSLVPGRYSMLALEYTRFPSLIMASLTFTMWNFVIAPIIYMVGMDTPEKKRKFLFYFTNFRLTQLHVFVILFASLNGVATSPVRRLVYADFYVAISIAVIYMLFYLLILDRIGVHTYPIFSPRTHWCVVTWSLILALYVGGFHAWNVVLSKGPWKYSLFTKTEL